MPARLLFVVLIGVTLTSFAGQSDKRLDVYWVDVEGGAATLMVMPTGESVLIDTGNPGRRDAQRIFDVAARVAGLRQIDHLVITHYHGDHFGGAATLASLMPIKNLYDNGLFEGGRERPDKAYLEFPAEKRQVISPGEQIKLRTADDPQSPPLSLKCLGARQQFVAPIGDSPDNAACAEAKQKDRDISDNANSVVLLLAFGPFKLFDAGDLTWNMEEKLACPTNLVGEVDVYQVTHHGLDSSNNPVLIKSLAPRVAIMNNGVTKGCQPATFQALKGAASIEAIYQGHKNLRPDGAANNAPDEFIANLEAQCEGNFIKLSVDPAARSYTVSIPAKGHERRYEVKSQGK
jgi:beta-lactamase superfamily II metal-dependent hydrolase